MHFQLKPGEVHALMGENGAGKSTFIKIITGVHQPDSGIVLLNGKPVTVKNTTDSQKKGIAAIYQHATVFPDLTVTENIFMGKELLTKWHTYNWKEMKFEDMYRLASRVTVLRDTQYIGTWQVDEISNADLIMAMVGRKLDKLYPEKTAQPGEELLRVENLGKIGYFKHISFTLRKGEILAAVTLAAVSGQYDGQLGSSFTYSIRESNS